MLGNLLFCRTSKFPLLAYASRLRADRDVWPRMRLAPQAAHPLPQNIHLLLLRCVARTMARREEAIISTGPRRPCRVLAVLGTSSVARRAAQATCPPHWRPIARAAACITSRVARGCRTASKV